MQEKHATQALCQEICLGCAMAGTSIRALTRRAREKDIALAIYCGADDEDCLPMARRLWEAARAGGVRAALTVQEHLRHQFPAEPYAAELPPAP